MPDSEPSPNGKRRTPLHITTRIDWDTKTGLLQFDWKDNQSSIFNLAELPQNIIDDLLYWGLIARIQQAYCTARGSPEAARQKADKLFDLLKSGDWGLRRGEKRIAAHRDRRRPGMRRLPGERDLVPLDAERAEHRAHREILAQQHRSLLDMKLEIGGGVLQLLSRAEGAIEVDPVRLYRIGELDGVAIGQVPHFIRHERAGNGA